MHNNYTSIKSEKISANSVFSAFLFDNSGSTIKSRLRKIRPNFISPQHLDHIAGYCESGLITLCQGG